MFFFEGLSEDERSDIQQKSSANAPKDIKQRSNDSLRERIDEVRLDIEADLNYEEYVPVLTGNEQKISRINRMNARIALLHTFQW